MNVALCTYMSMLKYAIRKAFYRGSVMEIWCHLKNKTKNVLVLKDHCPTEKTKLCLVISHVISPNTANYTTKLNKKIP